MCLTTKETAIKCSIQDGIYALGKAHMRSTPFLRSFPNVAFETSSSASSLQAPLLQAIDGVMSLALFPQVVLKLWNGSNVRLTVDGPLSSFQGGSSSASSLLQAIDGVMSLALFPHGSSQALKRFWPSLVLSGKVV